MGHQQTRRPRVVIVGAGFADLSAARALAREPVEVTLVDRHNYHSRSNAVRDSSRVATRELRRRPWWRRAMASRWPAA